MLNSVRKIGPVLELFTAQRAEWRLTEIARALDLPKSTVHELLRTLVEVGLLSIDERGAYRLGSSVLSLSERMWAGLDFRRHALADMEALSDDLLETVALTVLDRHRVVYVERVEGRHPAVRLAGFRVGASAPAHSTAAGKVLLSNFDLDVLQVLMDGPLQPLTPRTITDMQALRLELVRVQARGFALDLGETVPDITCVAAPIYDRYGALVAALSVIMPSYRFPAKQATATERLLETSAAVSARLRCIPAVEPRSPEPVEG